jgi:hypothetical protein
LCLAQALTRLAASQPHVTAHNGTAIALTDGVMPLFLDTVRTRLFASVCLPACALSELNWRLCVDAPRVGECEAALLGQLAQWRQRGRS